MKKLSSLFIFTLLFCAKIFPAVPFNVEIEQFSIPNSPGLHSFAFAQYNGKWLFIGGRTNGLHGLTSYPAFPRAYANRNIFVVDPNTNQVWSRNAFTDLPVAVADPLKSHNMEYYQNGQTLVMIGGMGIDSLRDSTVTFTSITAINVPGIINAIINNQNISSYVTQINDSRMQVCGGELGMIGNDYYLVGGHNFSGEYRRPATPDFFQKYTNQYKKFNLNIAGSSITVQNYVEYNDSVNLHRRDMNLVPMINPDGSESLSLYGGVFKYEKDLPYMNPVYINSSNYSVDGSFSQRFTQYNSAFLNMFDSVKKDMHTVFFGGTSLYYCDQSSGLVKIDTLVPFIKDITAISKLQSGASQETILPIKFTEYLGTNAKFILAQNIQQYGNGVVKLNQYGTRTLIGYMYGGIRVTLPNYTQGSASDRIFKIYVTYTPVGINQISSEVPAAFSLSQNYPNPFNPNTTIKFNVSKAGNVKVVIYNSLGKEIEQLVNNNLSEGKYEVNWNAGNQTSGVYFYKLVSENFSEVKKMMLMK